MYLFSKGISEIATFKCDLSKIPNIEQIELVSIYPQTDPPLQVKHSFVDCLVLKVSGGVSKTYNCKFRVYGSDDVTEIEVVIVNSDSEFDPLVNSAPDSFLDLLGTIRCGESALAGTTFSLPADLDVKEGYIVWELLNDESEVLADGNAFSYEYTNNGLSNLVRCQCVVVCPSYLEPTTHERRYQIRYTLVINDQSYYQYESLIIQSNVTVPLGSPDLVEIVGAKTTVSIVVPKLYENCQVSIYKDNVDITGAKKLKNPERVSSGWLYKTALDTSGFAVDLESYDVQFQFWNNDTEIITEASKLWIINQSIRSAADDVLAFVQKARATLYGSLDFVYTMPTLLSWLRRGRDIFNGWQGVFTQFTMTNAKGVVREYWLICAEMGALQSQYLTEADKAFNFSGSAIQLDVDRTGALDSMIGQLRGDLDQNLKPIKTSMTQKGYTSGDGSGTDGNGGITSSTSAIGAVGLSITPASAWGRFYPNYLIGRAWI